MNLSTFVYPLSILYFYQCHVIPFAYFGKGKTGDDVSLSFYGKTFTQVIGGRCKTRQVFVNAGVTLSRSLHKMETR